MLAILCPGQGGQHAGMFDLIAQVPAAQEVLDRASSAAGFDLLEAARGSRDIYANALAQPLICTCVMATWEALASSIPPPALFAGYSVGELAAYGCVGALSIADTVRLAAQRAALMTAATAEPAGLLALRGISRRAVDSLCVDAGAFVAIVNGDDHFILGGVVASLDRVAHRAPAVGANVQRLPVTVAAHTPLLGAAVARFQSLLDGSKFVAPRIPVLAGISGVLVLQRNTAIDALATQISRTIEWAACLDASRERGCRVFLELGPGNALARMTRERFADVAVRSVADFRSLEGVAKWVERACDDAAGG